MKGHYRTGIRLLKYLGGEVLTPGGVSVQANLPSEATIVDIGVEGQNPCYFAINGTFALATSPGYVPSEEVMQIGPIGNFTRLDILSSSTVHLSYYRDG